MSKIKLWTRLGVAAVVVSLFLSACYSYHDETYLDELDLTATFYDTSFNFQQYNTFAIRDSVGLVTDYLTPAEKAAFYAPGGGSDKIKTAVRNNFTSLGYTEVANDETYDFGVNLAVMLVENTTYYYPGWWYGYYDYYSYWWYGGWYPYYGYGWGYYSYTYTSGTLLIEMADGNSLRAYRAWADEKTQGEIENSTIPADAMIKYEWQALINGVAGETAGYNQERAQRGIDEAFTQSPYLKKN
jgi:hypothetical protein